MARLYFSALMLCAAIAVLFGVQELVPGFTEQFVLDAELIAFEPWRLITSVFLHGSLGHLMANLFALGVFGLLLEKEIGTGKFLLLFLGTGLCASAASAVFYPSSLGASGAIFGLIGALTALRPRMMVWALGVPMPMAFAAVLWFLLDITGLFFPTNVANIAHIAGLLIGLVVGGVLRLGHHSSDAPRRTSRPHALSNEEFNAWEREYITHLRAMKRRKESGKKK